VTPTDGQGINVDAQDHDAQRQDAPPPDAPPPDAQPPDAGSFCGGTAIAGTCLSSFFATAAACFIPSGSCTFEADAGPVVGTKTCWTNGAHYTHQGSVTNGGFSYFSATQLCFYGSRSSEDGGGSSYTFTIDGNQLLVYDDASGATTCLDGSRATLAPHFAGCAAILALLAPDTSSCSPGTCP
jgi:hypothetical protein